MPSAYQNVIFEAEHQIIGSDSKHAKPHHDNSIEILQTWSTGGFFIAKNNIFPIEPGSLFIINAMEMHYSSPDDCDKYNRSKVILSTDCFNRLTELCNFEDHAERFIRQTGGFSIPFNPRDPGALEIDSLFHKIKAHYPTQGHFSNRAIIIDCIIQILITAFSRAEKENVKKTENTQTIHLLTEYINSHLISWDSISLDNICDSLHISYSYASHLFKRLTGKSISRYVADLRISEAKKLLLNTGMKIYEISDFLKFHDSTIFCKTFKKHVKCTPREYREAKGVVTYE